MRFLIGESDVLCVDFDERSLRLIEACVSRGGVKLRSAVIAPMSANPDDPVALGGLIRRAMTEHRLRAKRVFFSVSREDALFNLLYLPQGSRDELAAMVHIQIAKDLPFAKDQTVIDFAAAARSDDTNTLDVWVAAVRNNVIDFYRQTASAAGLRLDRLGLRPYSNLAALNASVETTGRTLLVDVGPSMTEIDLVNDGRLAYSRSATVGIPAGGAALGPAETDSLLVEVNRTIAAYRSTDPTAKIDRIVLAGIATLDQAMVRLFQERFGAPASVFAAPAALEWKRGEPAAPFNAVLGLALGAVADNLQYFNLLAPKEPEGERRERIRKVPYKAAIAAGLLAVTAVAAYIPVYQRHVEIVGLQKRIDDLNKDKADRDELSRVLGEVDGWRARSPCWIDHLKQLAEVFPSTKGVYIHRFEAKETGEIVLTVRATDKFQAGEIVRAVNQITDKGKPVYVAKVGVAADSPDPAYPKTDQVSIQIAAMTPSDTRR